MCIKNISLAVGGKQLLDQTYIDVVLDFDEMTSPQIGWRQWWNVETLVYPLVDAARSNFAARYSRQLALLDL